MIIALTMAPCRRLQFNLSDLYPLPRLGIAQLAAVARRDGHDVRLVDAVERRWSAERLGAWVADQGAAVLGVSATILSMREAFELCAAARAQVPGLVTVVGGPGVGRFAGDELFGYSAGAVDFFVRGEGEDAFRKLLDVLGSGGGLDGVPNLLWRRDGVVQQNRRSLLDDLDALPGPAWDLLPMETYRLHPPMGVYPYATILETARGCTYPCSFCCLGGPYRCRSTRWIADQLRMLRARHDLREVHFVDPTFTLDRSRTLAVCDVLKALPFELKWTCKTRVDCLDEGLVSAMASAGCFGISFGVESGSDVVLGHVKKRVDLHQTREAFRMCRANRIRTTAYCVVGSPGETDETVAATMRFVREIKADYVLYGMMDADPTNALTRKAVSAGLITRHDLAEFYLGAGDSALQHTTVTGVPVSQAQAWLTRATSDFYLRPSYVFGRVRDLRSMQDGRNLMQGGTGFLRDLLNISRHWRRRTSLD